MHGIKHIVWSVDVTALENDRDLQVKCLKTTVALTQGAPVRIEPVYVLGAHQLKTLSQISAVKLDDLKSSAENRLAAWLNKMKLAHLGKPTVVLCFEVSLRAAVDTLLTYAKTAGADLIAVGTHSRKGISRFLLGSFAESLVLHSETPVFVVNPKSQVPKKFKEILFPTDFSPASHSVLQRVSQLAQSAGARVTLFHQVEYLSPYFIEPVIAVPNYNALLKQDIERRASIAEKWRLELDALGVKARVVINKKGGFAPEAILQQARKTSAGIIALASQTGPVVSSLIGSTSRQVVRQAPCPVWIVHPHDAARA